MKKFKYQLAIEGTKEQLIPFYDKLKELGYAPYDLTEDWVENNRNCVVTRCYKSEWQFTNLNIDRREKDSIIVSASNPDLVLALAAMTDGNDNTTGEWFVKVGSGDGTFTDGKLYKSIGPLDECNAFFCDNGSKNGYRSNPFKHFRKATKEEIISHFSPKTFNESTPMEKKIIGYKLKDEFKQYEEAASTILKFSNGKLTNYSEGYNFTFESPASGLMKKAGVLDLWFEPVYEEEFTVGDKVVILTCDVQREIEGKTVIGTILNVDADSRNFPILVKEDCKNTKYEIIYCSKVRLATPEEIAAAQTKVITLRCEGGTFEIEVSKKGIYYKPETCFLSIPSLKIVVAQREIVNTDKQSNFLFKPSHIDSGCKKQVPIEDWKKVLEAYDSINK